MGRGRKRHRRKPGTTPDPQIVEIAAPVTGDDPTPVADLVAVAPEDVEEIWPLAEELLAPEIPKTDWTTDQLKVACIHGVATLWMICNHEDEAIAAMVTILTPQQRCLVAICCGNKLWDYIDTRHQLYGWAKEQGMKEVTFYGRDALAKLMPECKRVGVILRKEL